MSSTSSTAKKPSLFALYSKRNKQCVAGCVLRPGEKLLSFRLEGKYYPRFVFAPTVRVLKEKEDDLEIHSVLEGGKNIKLGAVPFAFATVDDFNLAIRKFNAENQQEDEEEEIKVSSSESEEEEKPELTEEQKQAIEAEKARIAAEEERAAAEALKEKARLLAQQDADRDSEISSDEDEVDELDAELAEKYDVSSSQEPDDSEDSDVEEVTMDAKRELFEAAPELLTVVFTSGLVYEIKLCKDNENENFRLEAVEIKIDSKMIQSIEKKKKKLESSAKVSSK